MQTLASNSRYSGRTLDIFVEKRLCFDAEAIKKSSPPRELLLFQFVILLRSLRRGMVASENKVHQCNILHTWLLYYVRQIFFFFLFLCSMPN